MSIALTLAAWACGLLAVLSLARAFRLRPRHPGAGPWTVAALWACLLAGLLAWLGVAGLPGIIAAAALAGFTVVSLRRSGRAGAHVAAAPVHLARDAAFLTAGAWRLARGLAGGDPGGPGPEGAPAPRFEPLAGATGGRAVPSLREDAALGPAPAPAEAAGGAPVPVPWAELAGWIAGFVAEDDNAQSAFLAGAAAGLVAVAQALGALAETAINDIGLDPAYGAALVEVADRVAETSGDVALADQRYHVIYGELKQAVEAGLVLPHNARQFFGGGGTAAA